MTVDESDFFREMTVRICGSLDIDQALGQAFDYLARHIPVDAMGLGYSDLDSARIRVLASVTHQGARPLWHEGAESIALPETAVAQIEATNWPPFTVINRSDDPAALFLKTIFPGLESNSALFLRLDIRQEEVGALLISAEGTDRYSAQHAAWIESLREPFAIAMSNARRYQELERTRDLLVEDNRALSADIQRAVGFEVVGADFGLREVMKLVRQVAPSVSPTLLLGETGTGKEVIANAIHAASPRSNGPMITMQCGATPESLLDSELFGHEKGAFTGATERKRGRFERADGGTLFLDEIGELSPEAQVKLLRVLQEQRFERVGGIKTLEVDVRVIAATHRDLDQMVRNGEFREDLWYRLNVLPIRIPPLRLRRQDIPSLVQYFVERKAHEMSLKHVPSVSGRDLERLNTYDWPGNVRELQNIVERALILSQGEHLAFPELAPAWPAPRPGSSPPFTASMMTLDEAMAAHIRSVLDEVDWQVAGPGGAAELLQMNPSTLRFRMKKLGLTKM